MVTAFWRQHEVSFLSFSGDILACVVIGVAMGVMIELPILHLRDKLVPSSQRSCSGSTPASAAKSDADRTMELNNAAIEHSANPLANYGRVSQPVN